MHNIEALVQSPTSLQRVASRVIKDAVGTPLATLGPNEKKNKKKKIKKVKKFLRGKKFFQANIC